LIFIHRVIFIKKK